MSCPHSNLLSASPDKCSLCLEKQADASFAVHSIVIKDGALLVDGVNKGNIREIGRQRQIAEEFSYHRARSSTK